MNKQIIIMVYNFTQYFNSKPIAELLGNKGFKITFFLPESEKNSNEFSKMYYDLEKHFLENNVRYITTQSEFVYDIYFSPGYTDDFDMIKSKINIRYQYGFSILPEHTFRNDNIVFDFALCYGEYDSKYFSGYCIPWIVGNPKHMLSNQNITKNKQTKHKKIKILYLPTWGTRSTMNEFLDLLQKITPNNDFDIDIKLHHGTDCLNTEEEKIRRERALQMFSNVYHSTINIDEIIPNYDLIISDKSGAIWDAIYMEKPVCTFVKYPDSQFYGEKFLLDYCIDNKIIYNINSVDDIMSVIKVTLSDKVIAKQLKLKKYMYSYGEKQTEERILDLLKKIYRGDYDEYLVTHGLVKNNFINSYNRIVKLCDDLNKSISDNKYYINQLEQLTKKNNIE